MIEPGSSRLVAFDPLERARRHIEANLLAPLSLRDLAEVAGVSPFHFSRQFAARFGASPMAFVRLRRLFHAAERLSGPSPPSLIDLAFDCGFDSQEAFSRAFARAFGAPPGRFRRIAAPRQEFSMPNTDTVPPTLSEAATPALKPAVRLAGLTQDFDDTNKTGIPRLWDRLMAAWPGLPGGARRTFGVCAAGPQAESGGLRYMAAAELGSDEAVPEGLEVLDLPARRYLVFRQVLDGGDLHPQMQAAAREIWGHRVPRSRHRLASAPDLEVYPEDFRPDRAGAWVEWWLPVET